jgi:hypothetical protein
MAEISGEASKAETAWFSSSMRGVERALRALGRLSVTGVGKLELVLRGAGEEYEGALGLTLTYSWSWFGGVDEFIGFD